MEPLDPRLQLGKKLEGLPPLEELTVLNLGSGDYTSALGGHILDFPFKWVISVDTWRPALMRAVKTFTEGKQHKASSFIPEDIRTMEFPSADVVLLFDVLEHMEQEEVESVLAKVRCIYGLRRIIVFGPVEAEEKGFRYPEEPENPYSFHKVFLKPEWFRERGYSVEILNGFHRWEPRGEQKEVCTGDAFWAVKDV